jgi:two-component system cell cycle response regulator DivK
MCFKERDKRDEQCRIVRPLPKLVGPDSGHVEEPVRPAWVLERCGERCKGEGMRIVWRVPRHDLKAFMGAKGSELAKILIVEDNALNIKLFCDLLAAHGHEPEAVTDSRNALDAARNFSPDLVITDIQLPHVSGLDLIRMIRKDENLSGIPIMAVTAYSAQGDEERIREAGAQAYVSKPISVAKFAQTVDDLLKEQATEPKDGLQDDGSNESDDDPGPGEAGAEETSG